MKRDIECKSAATLHEIVKEFRNKLKDIDQKIDHLIRNLRRFNHSHFDSHDESP